MASPSSMRSAIEILRGAVSTLFFVLFGIGAVLVSPLVALLGRPDRGQPVVRFLWRPLVALFVRSGLIGIDADGLKRVRGMVLAATHPSFIDVVLLTVLMPRTLYVAKHGLKHNPFMSLIVRSTALPDDATLLDVARPYLAQGWNVLIFPEGTRSPAVGLRPFHRGAARLALRAGVPIAPIAIRQSYRILGKDQRPWEMGRGRVRYTLRMGEPFAPACRAGETEALAARRVTDELRRRIGDLLS